MPVLEIFTRKKPKIGNTQQDFPQRLSFYNVKYQWFLCDHIDKLIEVAQQLTNTISLKAFHNNIDIMKIIVTFKNHVNIVWRSFWNIQFFIFFLLNREGYERYRGLEDDCRLRLTSKVYKFIETYFCYHFTRDIWKILRQVLYLSFCDMNVLLFYFVPSLRSIML